MGSRGRALGIVVLAWALMVGLLLVARVRTGDRPASELFRTATARGGGVRAELHMPATADTVPLVVAIFGGGAAEAPDADLLGPGLADALVRRGVGVGLVRFELADDFLLPACLADVAAAVRALREGAGGRAGRVTLYGYGPGALLAARLALDAPLSARAGLDGAVGGVVGLRGTYDLSDAALEGHPERETWRRAFADDATRGGASPRAHCGAHAPPFLLLSAGDDHPEWAQLARGFARCLSEAGAASVQSYVAPGRDRRTLVGLGPEGDDLGALVTSFVRSGPAPLPAENRFRVKQLWASAPPFASDAFWEEEDLIAVLPVDDRLRAMIRRVLADHPEELHPWPGRTYAALDLEPYLARRAVGEGDHLVVTNLRGEETHLTRAELAAFRPVVVVGIDDERNLHRLFVSYRMGRGYSWRPEEGERPTMIRPVGAFLHFVEEPPAPLVHTTYAAFGLSPESFRFVRDDPLAAVRGLPPSVLETLVGEQGCLGCHALRGAGARSHHVRAEDARPHGAYALALEEYPADVLRRFLFDQEAVAASFNVTPLPVPRAAALALFALVTGTAAVPSEAAQIRYLALGDSFTAGTGVRSEEAFPARLAERWRGSGRRVALENLAVAGATSEDVLARQLPAVAGFAPTLVTLAVGANDCVRGVTPERYREHVRAILRGLAAAGVPPSAVVTLPQPAWSGAPGAASFGDPAELAAAIARFDAVLREETAAAGGRHVELAPLMRAQAERRLLSADGLHPSAAAYEEWAAEIERRLGE